TLQRRSFTRWIEGRTGNHKIGENYFVLHDGSAYYRNIIGAWHTVDVDSIFDLTPTMTIVQGGIIELLESTYEPSVYDAIYTEWRVGAYEHEVPSSLFKYSAGESTPEKEIEKSIAKIKEL